MKTIRNTLVWAITVCMSVMPVAGYATACSAKISLFYINGVSVSADNDRGTDAERMQARLVERAVITTETVEPLRNPSDGIWRDILGELASQKQAEKNTATYTYRDAVQETAVLVSSNPDYFRSQHDQDMAKAAEQEYYKRTKELPTTTSATSDMVQSVSSALSAGNKTIVIAHSQGNMFANAVLASVTSSSLANEVSRLKIVSIATPASTAQDNRYFTAKQDKVITWLSAAQAFLAGYLPPLAPTDKMDVPGATNYDFWGHGLLDVYFNTDLAALDGVVAMVFDGINKALCPGQIAATCPNMFTQTQLAQIKTGMTVPQVDNIFGCTGRSQNGGYAYLWYNDLSLFDPTMDYATVLFTNGIYQGGPSTKYIIGPVFP